MKKLIYGLSLVALMTSCASIAQIPNPTTDYQKTKPLAGQPQREIRPFAFIIDILLGGVPLAVDFATCRIYREAPKHSK